MHPQRGWNGCVTRKVRWDLTGTGQSTGLPNRMIESYHGHLKMDYLWTAPPRPYAETRGHLVTSLRHYNEERPHSSLNYLTPTEYAKKVKEEA